MTARIYDLDRERKARRGVARSTQLVPAFEPFHGPLDLNDCGDAILFASLYGILALEDVKNGR